MCQGCSYEALHLATAEEVSTKVLWMLQERFNEVRTKVDQFFDGYGAEQVVFTSGITESLNTVIKGSLNHGDHVITTFMEHNSVLRPLYEMERQGVCLTITSPDVGISTGDHKDTKMIVMTHASNVTGEVFDIQSVGKLCREKGILFVVEYRSKCWT